ncbi:uncharacterized protein PgNI_08579, partial [Pyricularia grisea]|uniref:Uncharacterized protein n=1 Tax=Pyricularia grisea TaxID=148305 RepID=A0A6P8AU54_PYRGI
MQAFGTRRQTAARFRINRQRDKETSIIVHVLLLIFSPITIEIRTSPQRTTRDPKERNKKLLL